MKKRLTLVLLSIMSIFILSCEDTLNSEVFNAYNDQPVGIWLENNDAYSDWVALLKRTNLYNAVNVKTKFTCFIVNNSTLKKWLDAKGYATIDDIPIDEAIYLIKYHIIAGAEYLHSSFTGMIRDTTASGDYLTVKYGQSGINSIYVNNDALIVTRDIRVINGYLHELDKVLDPIIHNVWDIIKGNSDYSIFKEAIELCALDSWLQKRRKIVDEQGSTVADYKAVLVVSNSVFASEGINSIEDLKNRFAEDDYTSEESEFYKYVAYHILNTNSDFSDLSTFPEASIEKKKNLITAAKNQLIAIEEYKSNIIFNKHIDSVVLIKEKRDQQGNNGFVHEVNHWMPVQTPNPAYFEWWLCDNEDMRKLSVYNQYPGNAQLTYQLDRDKLVDVDFFTVPDNNGAVVYNYRYNTSTKSNAFFLMRLGYVGWAKVKTPVIVKGKYNVKIWKFAWSSVRGTCQMYIDEEPIGAPLNFCGGTANIVDLGTREFLENGRHEIKFVAIKPGDMEVDKLYLTPIKD